MTSSLGHPLHPLIPRDMGFKFWVYVVLVEDAGPLLTPLLNTDALHPMENREG